MYTRRQAISVGRFCAWGLVDGCCCEGQRGTWCRSDSWECISRTNQQPRGAIKESWFRSAIKSDLVKENNPSTKTTGGALGSPGNTIRRCLERLEEGHTFDLFHSDCGPVNTYTQRRAPFTCKIFHRFRSAVHILGQLSSKTILWDTVMAPDLQLAWHLSRVTELVNGRGGNQSQYQTLISLLFPLS